MDGNYRISICILGGIAGGSLALLAYLEVHERIVPNYLASCLSASLGALLVLIQVPRGPGGGNPPKAA